MATEIQTPRWHRRPDARPEEILDAAAKVFGENGFARARLEDVAREAGVSKGTVYLYFDGKETLFREMVRAKIVSAVATAEELARGYTGSARELMVELVRGYWRLMREEEMVRISRLCVSELGCFPELAKFYYDEVILRARRLIETVMERGVRSGEFRPVANNFLPRGLPMLVIQAAQAQCFFTGLDAERLTDQQVFEGVVDLLLHGVLARPAEPGA
ncbi:MAG TPA: TetR/AcrR family transcriptional regulator [Gemmatimonadales bacterium]|nr:TetR/AcrR family transcriptional regulator [Gemmatimonadales bacterium]